MTATLTQTEAQFHVDSSYNGWTNYETWNVSLYIQNTEHWYHIAQTVSDYEGFVIALCEYYQVDPNSSDDLVTLDGVSLADPLLDIEELNELIDELND